MLLGLYRSHLSVLDRSSEILFRETTHYILPSDQSRRGAGGELCVQWTWNEQFSNAKDSVPIQNSIPYLCLQEFCLFGKTGINRRDERQLMQNKETREFRSSAWASWQPRKLKTGFSFSRKRKKINKRNLGSFIPYRNLHHQTQTLYLDIIWI